MFGAVKFAFAHKVRECYTKKKLIFMSMEALEVACQNNGSCLLLFDHTFFKYKPFKGLLNHV
jgi:hypothetical protein